MADLGMDQPVHRPAVHHHAAADPGADRQIDVHCASDRSTPTPLRQSRARDIGIEPDWDIEAPREIAANVRPRPAGFGCRRNRPEIRSRRIETERPEAADPDRLERLGRVPSGKGIPDCIQRCRRIGGGKSAPALQSSIPARSARRSSCRQVRFPPPAVRHDPCYLSTPALSGGKALAVRHRFRLLCPAIKMRVDCGSR
jgi:hypothetical protein